MRSSCQDFVASCMLNALCSRSHPFFAPPHPPPPLSPFPFFSSLLVSPGQDKKKHGERDASLPLATVPYRKNRHWKCLTFSAL